MSPLAHAPIAPVLLPLVAGVALVFLSRAPIGTQRAVGGLAVALELATALALLAIADRGAPFAYAVGDWAVPWRIVLVVDRLAAWMLLLTALVASASFLYACAGEDGEGPWFHALFQFQVLGLDGAVLTADLVTLFVCFEILLIASYALLLHGGGVARTRAAVHVVVLNRVGSVLFLVAVACVYGATGTLALADLAVKAPAVGRDGRGLLEAGAGLLLVVLALKAAALPLGFWLPRAHAAAPAAVAALFAVPTAVGGYAILRLYTLAFPCFAPGPCGPSGLVLPLGLATIAFGAVGALAAARLRPLAGWLVIVSVGTLLVAIGTFREAGAAAAVYCLAHATLAGACAFLVADLIARQRGAAERLDVGAPLHDVAGLATLAGVAAVALVGLPPLSGFVGQLAVLQATAAEAVRVWTIVLVGTLLTTIAAARAASALFWRPATAMPDPADVAPAAPLTPGGARPPWPARAATWTLALLLVALTIGAGAALDWSRATARQLADRAAYRDAVRSVGSRAAPPVSH